jgi:hypothetical protein
VTVLGLQDSAADVPGTSLTIHLLVMKRICALALFAAVLLIPPQLRSQTNPFAGRWDITVTPQDSQPYPDWMELVDKGGKFDVRVQPRAGSVHPVQNVKMDGTHLTLGVSRGITWELDVTGAAFAPSTGSSISTISTYQLTGVQKTGNAVTAHIAGVRAPELKRAVPKAWTDPEPLLDGKDLTGWEPFPAGAANHWVMEDGVLLNQEHGANLKTARKFDDFNLHIEYNCPEDGNSGIYLRGRDEIQVAYEKAGVNDKFHDMGAIYGFLAPAVELPRKPGQWESFDVTLLGRYLTIIRNGVKTVDNREIPGISGGALDANEGEPGPFYLQGDHTGGMKYRNITVSIPK